MRSDDAIYTELSEIKQQLRRARALKQWIALDIAIHCRLMEASGLTSLLPMAHLLTIFLRRFRESVKKAEWTTGTASHQRIIDHLRDGNVDAARDELRSHIESHEQRSQRTS